MRNKFEINLALLPRELKVLLELIKADNNEQIKLNQNEWFKDIDWTYFLQLVRHHRVYPLVYLKLKDLNQAFIPEDVKNFLYKEYRNNTFNMLQLSGEMEQVSKLFNEKRIKVLFLKGPVVAKEIFGSISLRTSKDLDILVRKEDLEIAEALLSSLGYIKEEVQTVLNEEKWRKHHVEYFHSKKRIQIEVHWRLHDHPMQEPTFNEMWERKRPTDLVKTPAFFLGEEDLFLHLTVHGARHGWFRLRWLKDIDQIIRRGIDFEKINLLAKKYNYSKLVAGTFVLTSQLLNSPLDENIKKLAERNHSKNLIEKTYSYIRNSEEFTYDNHYMFSLYSYRQKFLYILILFYPNSLDIKTMHLPKPLHFLYFPLHPFLWGVRKLRKIINVD